MYKTTLALVLSTFLLGCNSGGGGSQETTNPPTQEPDIDLPAPPIEEELHCSEFTILEERRVSEDIYQYTFDSNLCNNLDEILFNGDTISRWYFDDENMSGFTQFYYTDEGVMDKFHAYLQVPEIKGTVSVSTLNSPGYVVETYRDENNEEVVNRYPINSEDAQLMISLVADLQDIEAKWFEATHTIDW